MISSIDNNTLQTDLASGNWRSLTGGLVGSNEFTFAKMTIPDDWRHQGLDSVFGFSKSDAVGAALKKEKGAYVKKQ